MGLATPRRAQYNLSGGRQAYVQMLLPQTATLTNSSAATMTVTFSGTPPGGWDVTGAMDYGTNPTYAGKATGYIRLSDATPGIATLYLGGTLSAAANQAPGDYNGTYSITFAYR